MPESAKRALEDAERHKAGKPPVLWASDPAAPLAIHAGYGQTCEGLEDTLMTMKLGECAVISVSPAYGFLAHDGEVHPGEGVGRSTSSSSLLLSSLELSDTKVYAP